MKNQEPHTVFVIQKRYKTPVWETIYYLECLDGVKTFETWANHNRNAQKFTTKEDATKTVHCLQVAPYEKISIVPMNEEDRTMKNQEPHTENEENIKIFCSHRSNLEVDYESLCDYFLRSKIIDLLGVNCASCIHSAFILPPNNEGGAE